MKKVKRRAASTLLIACALIFGMVLYVVRFATDGADWAMFSANKAVYSGGVLSLGTLTDRNGVVLAEAADGINRYSFDSAVRISSLHAVGDYSGNIGTGALKQFSQLLAGYSAVTGFSGEGVTLALSIDSELNKTAYAALGGQKGAVMVMDYETGEILCMVSAPGFDPNYGFDAADPFYEGAYINRCISSSYTPGSVFKLVTIAAAIENIPDIYERSFYCSGSVEIGGVSVKCSGTHGTQTIEQALANSCNCAFGEISLLLGADTLAEYADKLGFTQAHSINGIETAAGSFEKAEADSGDLAWSGIGQYKNLVTPYSMLRYVSAIANGGSAREGSLLLGEKGGSTRLLSEKTAESIADMMSYTVTYAYGPWLFPNLTICAKSGTAEVGDGNAHSWFTGFLRDEEHPYAFVVIAENGGGGLGNAGAIANTVLQAAVK